MSKMISMTMLALAIGGLGGAAWAGPRAVAGVAKTAEKSTVKKKKKIGGAKRVRKHAPTTADELPNS